MKYDRLRLKNQLCHPLYTAANAVVRAYDPFLQELDLTYPQYLVMMALWEEDGVPITRISEATAFDSGSLTPILKRLSEKGFIKVAKSREDLRQRIVTLTRNGQKLRDEALQMFPRLASCFTSISPEEISTLKTLLEKLAADLNCAE